MTSVPPGHRMVRLGGSGLHVSRLALGTMTFGRADWGCDAPSAEAILDAYLELGGNLVDTADVYASGESERIVGDFLERRGLRESVVLCTKYSLGSAASESRSGGNGRRNLLRSLDGSLRRLRCDHVDLLLVHAWDGVTPAEEVMRALHEVVVRGKVRYVGFSNVPAWYAAQAHTLAAWRGYEPPCVLQLEYSLIERGLEYEFPSMCAALPMHLMPWSPLAGGMLRRFAGSIADLLATRARRTANSVRVRRRPPEQDAAVVAAVNRVAEAAGCTAAQVAINWLAHRPAVGPVLLGASGVDQLEETMRSLDFPLPMELVEELDDVSAPPDAEPYGYLPWAAAGMVDNAWTTPTARLGS